MTEAKTLPEALAEANALDGPLQDRLDAYRIAHRELSPTMSQAYERWAKDLDATVLSENSPDIGDPLPDFLLPNAEGRLVSLADFLNRGPVVISFNRGHWCSFCKLELYSLARIYPDVLKQGADIVSIVPEFQQFAQKLRTICDVPFQILSDVDNGYGLSLGLLISIRREVSTLLSNAKINIPSFQGNEGLFLPIPATFVVDQDGIIRAKFAAPDFRRRMDPEDIFATLQETRAS